MSFSYRKYDVDGKDNGKQEALLKLYNKKNEQFQKNSLNMIKILQKDDLLLNNTKQLKKSKQKNISKSQQLYTPLLSPFLKQQEQPSFPSIIQSKDLVLIQDDNQSSKNQQNSLNQIKPEENNNDFLKDKYKSQPSLGSNVFNFNLVARKSSLLSDTHASVLNNHKKNSEIISLCNLSSGKKQNPSIHYSSQTEDHGYQLKSNNAINSNNIIMKKNQTINILNVDYKVKDDDNQQQQQLNTTKNIKHNHHFSSTMHDFKNKLNSIDRHNQRNISYMNEQVKSEQFQISLNDELCKLLEENNKIIQQKKFQARAHLESNQSSNLKPNELSQSQGTENITFKQISGMKSPRITDLIDQFPETTFLSNLQQFKSNKLEKSSELFNNNNNQGSSLHNKMQSVQQEIQNFLSTEEDSHAFKSNNMFNLAKSLRKANPNFFKDTPSGRSEVLALRKWLEDTLNDILKQQQISNKERIQRADDAMVLTINELVRQISFHCVERGELIMQLFGSYFTLVQKFWMHEQDEKNKLKSQIEYQQNSFELKAKEQNDQKERELDNLRCILVQQTKNEEEMKNKIWEMEMSYKELANLQNNCKNRNKLLKQGLIKLAKENQQLRDRNFNKDLQMQIKNKAENINNSENNSNNQSSHKDKNQNQKLELQKLQTTNNQQLSVKNNQNYQNAQTSPTMPQQFSLQKQIENIEKNQQKINEEEQKNNQKENKNANSNNENEDDIDDEKDTASQISISELLSNKEKDTYAQNNMVIMKEYQEDLVQYKLNAQCQTDYSQFTKNEKIQTDLNLIDKKYNIIFENGKVDKIQEDESMKKELFATEEKETQIEDFNELPHDGNNKKDRQTMKKILQGHPIFSQLKEQKKTQLEMFFENIHILKQMLEEKNKLDQQLPDKKKQIEEEQKKTKQQYGVNDLPEDPPSPTLGQDSNRKQQYKLSIPGQSNNDSFLKNSQVRPPSSINQKAKKSIQVNELSSFSNQRKNNSNNKNNENSNEKPKISFNNGLNDSHLDNANNNSGEIIQNLQQNQVSISNEVVKNQIGSLITMYNLECERTKNLKESAEELMKIIKDWFTFSARVLHHIYKTQKNTHISVIESFTQQLTALRWKLPLELDNDLEKVLVQNQDGNLAEGAINQGQQKKVLKYFTQHRKTKNSLNNIGKLLALKMTMNDKMQHSGLILLEKVRDSSKIKKSNFLPMKNVLKIITQLYEERVRLVREQRLADDQEMSIFAFNKFINMFGFKNVAEKKFLQFLMSVKNYLQIFRINIFARLIGLMSDDKLNYSIEVMTKYFQAYEFIQNIASSGVQCYNNDQDVKFYVPFYRVLEFFKMYLEEKMSQEELNELRLYAENQKEPDKVNVLNTYMIDFDILMERVLAKYKIILNKTKTFVRHAFYAADLDGNGKINLNEFMTLYRHIEKEKFVFKNTLKMFEENADIITEEEKNLSFDKFTSLCVDFQMFTEKQQNIFIGLASDQSVPDKFSELKGKWPKEKDDLHYQLRELKEYVVEEDYKNWKYILDILEKRILQDTIQEDTMKPIMIAHKLLRSEIDRIIEEGQKVAVDNKDSDDEDESQIDTARQNTESIQQTQQQNGTSPQQQQKQFQNFLGQQQIQPQQQQNSLNSNQNTNQGGNIQKGQAVNSQKQILQKYTTNNSINKN